MVQISVCVGRPDPVLDGISPMTTAIFNEFTYIVQLLTKFCTEVNLPCHHNFFSEFVEKSVTMLIKQIYLSNISIV